MCGLSEAELKGILTSKPHLCLSWSETLGMRRRGLRHMPTVELSLCWHDQSGMILCHGNDLYLIVSH